MSTYRWKFDNQYPVKPEDAGLELERIHDNHGGRLLPVDVVDASRPKKALLHPCFEWSDEIAAEKYREHQASDMIRSIRVVAPELRGEDERTLRAFVTVVEDEDRNYTTIARAMGDDELRKQVLDRALHELRSFQKKYQDIKEFAGVMREISRVLV